MDNQPHHDDAELVREHEELLDTPSPTGEGGESLPRWLIVIFLVAAFVGAGYLFWNSGGFRSDVFNPTRVAWDGSGGGAVAVADPMVVGQRVFAKTCAVCHQTNGEGMPGQFPPLAGSEWVLAQAPHGDNHIVAIVLNGLQGVVTVKGQQFNSVMAPWGSLLKDDEIAAVLTYVRNSWGNQAPPITAEFVAKVRAETKSRTEAWTAKDLSALDRELVSGPAAAPAAAEPPAAPAGAPESAPATTPES